MIKTQGFPNKELLPGRMHGTSPWHAGVPGSLVWEALCGISHDYMGQPSKGFKRSEGDVVRLVLGLCLGDWGHGATQCHGGERYHLLPSALGLRASGPISGRAGGSDRQRAQGGLPRANSPK